jgi:hypothetical protein
VIASKHYYSKKKNEKRTHQRLETQTRLEPLVVVGCYGGGGARPYVKSKNMLECECVVADVI